ncbi:MAG: DNA starvation/stationary phase protection protein [Chlamydiae bacterium CG10_big_fil_rev_8_21_14_0_10_35_9]|nr:MAG: DNA starvation/stationary phase protection protein [Chlamydiae bacterium CG10_big_fil_rev_8_21_14_0_10_35_9]
MEVDIGITKTARKKIADKLAIFLADTYALYLKTQNFHWNVAGPEFFSLHLLFEKQYDDMAEAVDEIAERIRALGFYAPGSFTALKKLTKITEENKVVSSKEMLKRLIKSHEYIAKVGKPLIRFTQESYDDITSDMIIKRLHFHEKAAWMLRAHLEKLK